MKRDAHRPSRRRLLLAGVAAWPGLMCMGSLLAQTAPGQVLIGWITARSRKSSESEFTALQEGLAALGWKRPHIVIEERWPVTANNREFAAEGALLAYGANPLLSFRRAAHYVDCILKGAKPAELPIEQPNNPELVINGKTAKAIGIAISRELLLCADRVIE